MSREFESVLDSLGVQNQKLINKELLVKIFAKLALLKPAEEITSDFLRLENSKIFDCVWVHISGKPQTSPSKNPEAITAVPVE